MNDKEHNYDYDLLLKLAEDGDLFAMKEIASITFNDSIHSINYSERLKAFEYLKSLVENKDSEAFLTLGALYYSGETELVKQDYKKAEYYYNESLKLKSINFNYNTTALNNLGYCYYYGRNNEPDYKQAFQCFGKAAYLNHPNAMYKIGDMYQKGLYVKKCLNTAFCWYKKSYAYSGNDYYNLASVSQRIGKAYFYGEGTEINLLRALKYLQIAEKHFYSLAIKKPILSNSIFVNKPLKLTQELLGKVREQLNLLI